MDRHGTTAFRAPDPPPTGVASASGRLDPTSLLARLAGDDPSRLLHVHEVPAREARPGAWPEWTDPNLLGALLGAGQPESG